MPWIYPRNVSSGIYFAPMNYVGLSVPRRQLTVPYLFSYDLQDYPTTYRYGQPSWFHMYRGAELTENRGPCALLE